MDFIGLYVMNLHKTTHSELDKNNNNNKKIYVVCKITFGVKLLNLFW